LAPKISQKVKAARVVRKYFRRPAPEPRACMRCGQLAPVVWFKNGIYNYPSARKTCMNCRGSKGVSRPPRVCLCGAAIYRYSRNGRCFRCAMTARRGVPTGRALGGLRDRAYAILGRECLRCGEADHRALAFDHIRDDGAAHKTRSLTQWVVANPTEAIRRLQVLCANCNQIKEYDRRTREKAA